MNDLTANVPTTAPTVSFGYDVIRIPADLIVHSIVVLDVHALVEHASTPEADAVGVKLLAVRLSPVIVTTEPADVATFEERRQLRAGASKVNETTALVPTTAFTVTCGYDAFIVAAGIIGGFYFSFAYAHWRKQSRWQAFWVTAGAHAIHNSIAFAMMLTVDG